MQIRERQPIEIELEEGKFIPVFNVRANTNNPLRGEQFASARQLTEAVNADIREHGLRPDYGMVELLNTLAQNLNWLINQLDIKRIREELQTSQQGTILNEKHN